MKWLLSFIVFIMPMGLLAQADTWVSRDSSSKKMLTDKVLLRRIYIEGNKQTKNSIILRELSIREGVEVASDSLQTLSDLNWKRLFNLGLFTDIIIVMDTVNASVIDWYIKIKEQWYIWPELSFKLADRNFNVWWNEQNRDIRRANLGVTFKHRNFRGNMEQLGVTAQIGYTQRFGIDYFKPYIDKQQRHGLGASFFISKNEETWYITDSNKLRFVKTRGNYIIRQFECAGTYVYRPAYANRHLFEIRYRDYEVDDTVVQLNSDYYENLSISMKQLELLYRFERNKVDNWNYPMFGHKMVGYFVNRLGFEGMRFQSFLMLEYGRFYRIQGKFFGANIFRGRLTIPEDQPYAFRGAMGSGSEYLRGYEYYVVDGSQYGLLRTDVKYELLNVRIRNIPLKYLPVIPLRLYPKVFADIGYGKNRYPGNSFLNNRMLYSYGVGIDIITAYDFKFRLEYTWNHLAENDLFLHLGAE